MKNKTNGYPAAGAAACVVYVSLSQKSDPPSKVRKKALKWSNVAERLNESRKTCCASNENNQIWQTSEKTLRRMEEWFSSEDGLKIN